MESDCGFHSLSPGSGSFFSIRPNCASWQNTDDPSGIHTAGREAANRRFTLNQYKTMRCVFGQPKVSLDLGQALEEGSIILVNLATERAKISKENAELFAMLLLSDLWTAAMERGKRDGIKPFYIYLDEFQRFVTPTIAENLDEARGYGLHLTMANQFPNQLLNRGESGQRVYDSMMENASSKLVFRLAHEDTYRPAPFCALLRSGLFKVTDTNLTLVQLFSELEK